MNDEQAREWVAAHADTPISELWELCLREAWRASLDEIVEELDSIGMTHVALWSIGPKGRDNDVVVTALTERLQCPREEVEDALKRLNASHVPKQVSDLLGKADAISQDRGLDTLDIITEARASRNLATTLQKNATKQNPYEPIAAAFIAERTGLRAMRLSVAEKPLSIRFNASGDYDVAGRSKEGFSKDADIFVILESDGAVRVWLISHKYARSAGGHQDNQRKDAATYLAYAARSLEVHSDIPELRSLASAQIGRDVEPEEFTWEPALVLDGDYFASAPEWIRESGVASEAIARFFIGPTDRFVELLKTLTPSEPDEPQQGTTDVVPWSDWRPFGE